jgi:prevent-host-death family protein
MHHMTEVTIRELRNKGGEVVDRVAAGERLTVTRDGRPVAELRPYRAAPLSPTVLLRRWRRLPSIDSVALRRDVDAVIDPRF